MFKGPVINSKKTHFKGSFRLIFHLIYLGNKITLSTQCICHITSVLGEGWGEEVDTI